MLSTIVKNDDDTRLRNLKGKQKETDELSLFFCGIFMDAKRGEEMFRSQNCSHSFCDDCFGKYVAVKIQENDVVGPQYCRSIKPKKVVERWENALCENLIPGSQKFYCPFKDCSAMLISDTEEVMTSSECPHCNRLFCAQCKVSWHAGINCEEFQNLKPHEKEREDLMVMELAKSKSWKRCPKFYVEKVAGCIHISYRCGHEFCYTCGACWSYYQKCRRGK
uniref:RBR-type E3 ubiquitin transferase n=1 Tax=Cajanus cajan TaxID=3821 RepID=A0A151QLR5_CAJCA|nr:RING finger protein 31 [Cajanus cajan]